MAFLFQVAHCFRYKQYVRIISADCNCEDPKPESIIFHSLALFFASNIPTMAINLTLERVSITGESRVLVYKSYFH